MYAISLKWPGNSLKLRQIRPQIGSKIHLLGVDRPLEWHISGDWLVVELPDKLQAAAKRPCQRAYTFRIEGVEG